MILKTIERSLLTTTIDFNRYFLLFCIVLLLRGEGIPPGTKFICHNNMTAEIVLHLFMKNFKQDSVQEVRIV